jgi:hypothetical protein
VSRVNVVPYEAIHAFTIMDKNVRERDAWLSRYPDWEKWATEWTKAGEAYTLMADGEPIACAGVVKMEWRRGEAWLLASSLLGRHKVSAVKAIKHGLDIIVKKMNLRRVQCLVDPEYADGCKLMEWLGMVDETPGTSLRCYGPNGEDFKMYARVYLGG